MKRIFNRVLIILLSIFSFYYTNQVVSFLQENDPIMKEIKSTEKKYKIEAENAITTDNTIISGKKGKVIDYDKSYQKMKKYGTYNESLTVLKDTIPVISINNNYDKYLIGGNKYHKKVSLVFVVKEKDPHNIISILKQNKIKATFFIDGTFIENNINLLKNEEQDFELLSYQNDYNESFFKTSLSYLESITNNKAKFCYTEIDNNKLLSLCEKLKLHTIKPTLIIKKDSYKEVKENIDNGIIISLDINSLIEKELKETITYIKQKGYQIVPLEYLIEE